mgnify:CR=1 FL=1
MTENEKYLEWKEFVRDEELASDLAVVEGNEEEIFERFYRSLEFGTAGLRGILGAGTNRMNIYTVRQATQGLAEYLNAHKEGSSVAIAYDTRHNSEKFAKVPCHLWIPNNGKEKHSVVICLQGHASGMHISMGKPIYEGDEETISGGDRDFCVRAVKEGYVAVAVEQRNFGECGGAVARFGADDGFCNYQ